MMGLYQCTSGSVLLDGTDLQQIDPADVRRNIGFVSQDVQLFFGTLRENLTLGAPLADDDAMLAAARIAGLDRLVTSHPLGFDLMVGEHAEGLSGGQKQSVAIARALLSAPPMFLLDEPTSSMDHNSEQAFIAHFKTVIRGRTMVIATHKPAMLELVDRLIVLEGGKVAADGPRDTILKALTQGGLSK
jgi:ATP-binding cassette subfamily C protein LapB